MRERLKWLMAFRLVVATFLMGATILMGRRGGMGLGHPSMVGLWALVAVTYFLTLPYVWLLKRMENLRVLAWIQIMVDLILETSLVYMTGVEDSGFSSIYNLSIITGSILLSTNGAIGTATVSGMLYGAVLDLRYYQTLPTTGLTVSLLGEAPPTGDIFYKILINLSAFFLVAFLSSYLSEQVRISKEELKEAQSDLSDLTAMHEEILECLTSGLITTDMQGRISFANRASSAITGISRERLQQMSLTSLFPGLKMDLGEALDEDVGHKAGARRKIMDYVHPNGKGMKIGYSIAPLTTADGATVGSILHFQDLTEVMEMEEHLRTVDRLAAVGEMAARIAHEIRNPLASMSGSIQMLSQDLSLEGPNRRLMEIVLKEAGRLNALITDFLLYARPGKVQPRQVEIRALLEETLKLSKENQAYGGEVETRFETDPGFTILSDPQKLKQIIWNLLNNAFEAIKDGGKVLLESRPVSFGGQKVLTKQRGVLVCIEDTGPGIPPHVLPHIYDPFFTTKEKGSGLGLSIVHRIIQELGGRIEVKSKVGRGTRFEVWVPSLDETP
jgi:two-component system sensor histidine kinase PilS (NtrC family)